MQGFCQKKNLKLKNLNCLIHNSRICLVYYGRLMVYTMSLSCQPCDRLPLTYSVFGFIFQVNQHKGLCRKIIVLSFVLNSSLLIKENRYCEQLILLLKSGILFSSLLSHYSEPLGSNKSQLNRTVSRRSLHRCRTVRFPYSMSF